MELGIYFCHCINIEMPEFLFGYHPFWRGGHARLFNPSLVKASPTRFLFSFYLYLKNLLIFFFLFSYCFSISHLLGIIGDQQCLLGLKISITLLFPRTFPQGTIHLVQSVALLTD